MGSCRANANPATVVVAEVKFILFLFLGPLVSSNIKHQN